MGSSVAEAEAAVLGILFCRSCVDHAVHGLHDDIGCAAVAERIVESELEFRPGHHLIDEQRVGIGVQVAGNLMTHALVLQPD